MKVFFDYSIFTLQQYGGISNYIINLVKNFSKEIDPSVISLFHKNYYLKKKNKSVDSLFFFRKFGPFLKYINIANRIYFNYKVRKNDPQIIHQTYFNERNFYKTKAKLVISEYDLIKEKFYSSKFKLQIEYKKKIFQKADQIICISNNTKKDLLENYSIEDSKVSVVHLGTNQNKSFKEKSLNLRPYLLYVGTRLRYKNFSNAIKAYAKSEKINSNFDFVCFGGGNFSLEEEKLFRELCLDKKKIHYFDGNDSDLNYFYRNARLFIFPSLYEGFGLPLLESMNMGCPVICSNSSCFPEITNGAAVMFDPNDIDSIKYNLEKIMFDDLLLLDLKKKGIQNCSNYSWEKCASETEQLYKKLI